MIEYPRRPEGSLQAQIFDIWDYLFRLAEQLNIRLPEGGAEHDDSAGH